MTKIIDFPERPNANQEPMNEDVYRDKCLDALASLQQGNPEEAMQHLHQLLECLEAAIAGGRL